LAVGLRPDPLRKLKHSSSSCCGCDRRNVPSESLAAVKRVLFALEEGKGSGRGQGRLGRGTLREGTGKCIYNYYHCQRLHVQVIIHKTRSSIQALKPQSVDASRPCKGTLTVTLSDFLAAVSVRVEKGKERIGRANG
jgi:hypothetical protein